MPDATIFIVDDDAAVRDSLGLLCESEGWQVECFDSAEAFIAGYRPERAGCLVLDVRMPRMNGLELHERLARHTNHLPVIFLTAHGTIPMTVRALKAGAVDFLTKPVDGAVLVERIRAALAGEQESREREEAMNARRARLAELTEREREIVSFVLAGYSNKAIARYLGISHRTVEAHRSKILKKTQTASVYELAKLARECGFDMEPAIPSGS